MLEKNAGEGKKGEHLCFLKTFLKIFGYCRGYGDVPRGQSHLVLSTALSAVKLGLT